MKQNAPQQLKLGGEGGNNLPMILESNQNHAVAKETEVCPTLPASMGLGGGYVPMIVDTLVFDASQITSQQNGNRPTWGGVLPHSTQQCRQSNGDNQV